MGKQKSRRRTTGICAFCAGEYKITADHVPPRSFFPAQVSYALTTVPACSKCNRSFQADDEYFLATLIFDTRTASNPCAVSLAPKVIRGVRRHRTTGHTGPFVRSVAPMEVRSPAGIHLGVAPSYLPDHDRVARACAHIARGLYYHETGRPVPPSLGVVVRARSMLDPAAEPREEIDEIVARTCAGTRRIFGDCFTYCFRFMAEDPIGGQAIFWFLFYGAIQAICAVEDRASAQIREPVY